MLANLSYRYKIPLALTAVILLTEVVVTAALVNRAYADARRDLEVSAQSLARAIARSIRDPLARDDLWQVYETIRTPIVARDVTNPLREIVVLDAQGAVFAASDPPRFPVLMPADRLPQSHAALLSELRIAGSEFAFRFPGVAANSDVLAGMRVESEDGSVLGDLLIGYDRSKLNERIVAALVEVAALSIPGVLLLVALGWIAGERMTRPLRSLAAAMARVGRDPRERIASSIARGGRDEIGLLGAQFQQMLAEIDEKSRLERDIVASERLAAVGRVAAGIAHEINNPLGGMINAIDTLRRHGNPDPMTLKTLGLLERGLGQIRTTVGALLVEARVGSPLMSHADWQDLRTLIEPQLAPRDAKLEWNVMTRDTLNVPAHLVRQLALNLLLNAAKAVEPGGTVGFRARCTTDALEMEVENGGAHIPEAAMRSLFEPFNPGAGDGGRGFGLWVSYQIVRQLGGTIAAESRPGHTRFSLALPLRASQALAA